MAEFEVQVVQLSMGMTDVEVVDWLKQVGDTVAAGEPLVEVDTGKVVQEMESPEAGTVLRILVEPGQTANIGEVLCVLEVER